MALMQLYVHPVRRLERGRMEVLFGFTLTGHSASSSAQSVDQDRAKKIYHLLESQLHMVARFWNSDIAAWDLRYVKAAPSVNVATGLLCRIACPECTTREQYSRYCQTPAQQVQMLFKEFGYDLVPLSDWPGFKRFLEPFAYRSFAEIRRREDIFEIHYAHETYEFYVTYPWKWSGTEHRRALDTLAQLQDDGLVSICLQPTRLDEQEQYILQHVTSGFVKEELLQAGPVGRHALGIYGGFLRDLQRPFLLRHALAASSLDALKRVGQAFLEDLAPSGGDSRPVLQFPGTADEEQALLQGLFCLERVPWGNLRDNVRDTARLRYLVDSKEGSMAFRLPVTEAQRAVILTALGLEYEAVRRHLSEVQEETYAGTIYERGNFIAGKGRWEVVIAQIGAGGTATAAEAERAIMHFKPHVILFVGVAGGLKEDVALGDVVVATKVYGYDSGKVAEQKFKSRPEVGQSSHLMVQRARAEARKTDWLQRIQPPEATRRSSPRVFVGPIAAGEKLLASKQSDLYDLLQSTYEDALAIEMESHGFLQATHRHSGMEALIVRGISDLVDNKEETDKQGSQPVAARHASAFAFEILAQLDIQPQ